MILLTSRPPIGKAVGLMLLVGIATIVPGSAVAQSSGSIPNEHISFDRPEAWALKRFDAATLPSGLLLCASGGQSHRRRASDERRFV